MTADVRVATFYELTDILVASEQTAKVRHRNPHVHAWVAGCWIVHIGTVSGHRRIILEVQREFLAEDQVLVDHRVINTPPKIIDIRFKRHSQGCLYISKVERRH